MIDLPRPAGKPVLVLYAHPAAHQSRVNRRLAEAVRELPNVHLQDLYETYPDFDIDVPREQALMEAAELVVFLHPIQWYSMPALMKLWTDMVLQLGWAYGHGGIALRGKRYWLAATTGGAAASYQPEGYHGYPFDDFLPPFEMTARLCGMRWEAPMVLHGAHQVDEESIAAHVAAFRNRLASFPHWPDPAGDSHGT